MTQFQKFQKLRERLSDWKDIKMALEEQGGHDMATIISDDYPVLYVYRHDGCIINVIYLVGKKYCADILNDSVVHRDLNVVEKAIFDAMDEDEQNEL